MAADGPNTAVDKFFAAYRSADLAALLDVYAEEAIFEDVNQRHRFEGRAQLEGFLGQLLGVHLHMEIEEKRRLVSDNTVTVEIEYVGTLDCAAVGLPGETQDYRMPAVLILEIEDGRILRQTDYIDYRTFTEIQATVQKKIQAAASSGS